MSYDLLPHPSSQPSQSRTFRRCRAFFRTNGILGTGIFLGAFVFASLILYATIISPDRSFFRGPPRIHPELVDSGSRLTFPSPSLSFTTSSILDNAPPASPSATSSPSPEADVLTLEQIRDIVGRTRGFFSRDYSLGLGWNNVCGSRVCCELI
jgi:hypothetical protein